MGVRMVGGGQVKSSVRGLIRRTEDLRPVWPKVGAYMSRTASRQFSTKGAHLGTPWKPLNPEYRQWKVRNGYNRNILIMTGDMKSTFVGRPMGIEKYERDRAEFGSDSQLAIWHQKGTRRNGKRHIPARPILKVTTDVRRDVKEIIEDYITKGRER